jgi:uncharacterized membrane protein YfcA
MGAAAIGIIAVTILATSFVSGIFGMAGGLILLGVLLIWLDVAPAMVLFGTIQTAANGWRAILWRDHVHWSIIWRYLLGASLAFALMRAISFVPGKAFLYLGLGLIPFAAYALPKALTPDITRPWGPYICGCVILVLQLLAGATGHILDIFFQKSSLDRRAIVGTKAVTQCTGHLMRIAYFGSFASAYDASIPGWAYGGALLLAVVGTTLAGFVLERMTDLNFRSWSRRLTIGISLVYLSRGLWLLAFPE